MADIKKLPKSEIQVSTSVSWEEWSKHIDSAIKVIAQSLKVEGFRPGKAPKHLVEQRVGRETVLQEAADKAIQKAWEQLIRAEKLQAIGHPKAEIKKIGEGDALEFTITTAVMPTLAFKKNWREAIKKTNEEEKKKSPEAISEEAIEKELKKIADSRAKLVAVSRPAKKGDSVRLDFSVKMEGKVIEGGEAKDHTLVLGSGVFIPGFEEKIEGMKVNEEKVFALKFPEKYHEKTLAGKEAEFSVRLRAVEERQVPVLDDAIVASLGKFKNLEELKKSIRDGMEAEREQKREEDKKTALAETLLSQIETEIPDILVEEETIVMLREFESQISMMGATMEAYLQHIGKSVSETKEEMRPQAQKRLMITLGLLELAKSEGVDASNEEVEEEMNKTLRYYKSEKEAEKKLDMKRLYSYAKEAVVRRKVMEYIEGL